MNEHAIEAYMLLGKRHARRAWEKNRNLIELRKVPAELDLAGAIGWMREAAQISSDELAKQVKEAA